MKTKYGECLARDIPTAQLAWVNASHFAPADSPQEVTEAIFRLLDRSVTDVKKD